MPLTCYVHPRSSAGDRCAVCRRTICPACVVADRAATLCRSCADRIGRERRRLRGLLLLAGTLLVAAGLFALLLAGRG